MPITALTTGGIARPVRAEGSSKSLYSDMLQLLWLDFWLQMK